MKFKTLITAVFVLSVFTVAQAQLAMGKWRTQVTIKGKTVEVGRFNNIVDAAKTYDKVAKELFGDFCITNFK